jgi:putative ABC transport system permease protein
VRAPPDGLALPATLAEDWGIGLGSLVEMELLVPPRETHLVPVTALTRQSMGQDARMNAETLFALMRQAPTVNLVNMIVDRDQLPELYTAVKTTPAVAGVMLWAETRQRFVDEFQRNLWVSVAIYCGLGGLIAVGVVYNAARIQLSERAHELASLRVLGFGRGEVAWVLVGELMLLSLIGLPLGWIGGYGFAALTAQGLSTQYVSIPLVVTTWTYGIATLVVLAAALGSALLVRRRLDRIDIVSALKAKE